MFSIDRAMTGMKSGAESKVNSPGSASSVPAPPSDVLLSLRVTSNTVSKSPSVLRITVRKARSQAEVEVMRCILWLFHQHGMRARTSCTPSRGICCRSRIEPLGCKNLHPMPAKQQMYKSRYIYIYILMWKKKTVIPFRWSAKTWLLISRLEYRSGDRKKIMVIWRRVSGIFMS